MKELVNRFDTRLSRIVARAPRVLKTSGPIVSFTFDDIPATALRGADLLEGVGARGTFYIAAGLLGMAGTPGRHADQQEVSELCGRGHEIGCHTYSHARAASCSKSGFAAELDRNRDFLADVFGVVPKSFAFPFGSVSTSTKYVARARYSSCRTTRSLVQTTAFDAAGLGGFPVYSDPEHLRACDEVIEKNAGGKNWVILYTHDVERVPSAYGCQPDHLRHLIQRCKALAYKFFTVADVIEKYSEPL
jgi:peptidoglycan/xylan/chitin deacetylase (PgdA/CDA1 family)